jgi:hypothetical protein
MKKAKLNKRQRRLQNQLKNAPKLDDKAMLEIGLVALGVTFVKQILASGDLEKLTITFGEEEESNE